MVPQKCVRVANDLHGKLMLKTSRLEVVKIVYSLHGYRVIFDTHIIDSPFVPT